MKNRDNKPYVYVPDARLNWENVIDHPPEPPERQTKLNMDRDAVKKSVTNGRNIDSEQFTKPRH